MIEPPRPELLPHPQNQHLRVDADVADFGGPGQRDVLRAEQVGDVELDFHLAGAGEARAFGDLVEQRVNHEFVDLGPVGDKADELHDLVQRFAEETGSVVAAELLADWAAGLRRFSLVMPRDFRRVLDVRAAAESEGLDEDQTNARIMEVLHG